jgi:hypothetical protein
MYYMARETRAPGEFGESVIQARRLFRGSGRTGSHARRGGGQGRCGQEDPGDDTSMHYQALASSGGGESVTSVQEAAAVADTGRMDHQEAADVVDPGIMVVIHDELVVLS